MKKNSEEHKEGAEFSAHPSFKRMAFFPFICVCVRMLFAVPLRYVEHSPYLMLLLQLLHHPGEGPSLYGKPQIQVLLILLEEKS